LLRSVRDKKVSVSLCVFVRHFTRDDVDIEVLTRTCSASRRAWAGLGHGRASSPPATTFLGLGHQLENSYLYGRGLGTENSEQPLAMVLQRRLRFGILLYARARYR
jgi:hypothetical protein